MVLFSVYVYAVICISECACVRVRVRVYVRMCMFYVWTIALFELMFFIDKIDSK